MCGCDVLIVKRILPVAYAHGRAIWASILQTYSIITITMLCLTVCVLSVKLTMSSEGVVPAGDVCNAATR